MYRAIDEYGQIVDSDGSDQRAADDAATFFRRVIGTTGATPDPVTTDCAAASPPALAAALPNVDHETGQPVQQRIERDHQHLKGRLCAMRGRKTLTGARVLRQAHALLRNLRGGFYEFGQVDLAADTDNGASLGRAHDRSVGAIAPAQCRPTPAVPRYPARHRLPALLNRTPRPRRVAPRRPEPAARPNGVADAGDDARQPAAAPSDERHGPSPPRLLPQDVEIHRRIASAPS